MRAITHAHEQAKKSGKSRLVNEQGKLKGWRI